MNRRTVTLIRRLSCIVLLGWISLPRIGQAEGEKLGYVYSDQLLNSYQGMSDAKTALDRARADFKQQADSLYRQLTAARSDFEAQKLILSEEGKAAKLADIEEAQRRYDAYVAEVYGPGGKLEQKNQELMAPTIQKIKETVERVARSEGYTIVFDAAESKLAILYAASSADITSLVADELNREFKPVTPAAPVLKKRYAVCPLYETNDDAQTNNLGERCRALIYDVLSRQPKTEMVTGADLNRALLNRSISGRVEIPEEVVYDVGQSTQADYIFYGSVSMTGKKITITLNIADPRLKKTYDPETDNAPRIEELRTVLGNMALKLLKRIPQ